MDQNKKAQHQMTSWAPANKRYGLWIIADIFLETGRASENYTSQVHFDSCAPELTTSDLNVSKKFPCNTHYAAINVMPEWGTTGRGGDFERPWEPQVGNFSKLWT